MPRCRRATSSKNASKKLLNGEQFAADTDQQERPSITQSIADRQTDRQTQTFHYTEHCRQTDRQTDTDLPLHRALQTDRQTDRQTDLLYRALEWSVFSRPRYFSPVWICNTDVMCVAESCVHGQHRLYACHTHSQ